MILSASLLLLGAAVGFIMGARARRVLHGIEVEHERRLVEAHAAGHLDGRAAASLRFRELESRLASLERVAAAAERLATGSRARGDVVRTIAAHERKFGSLSSSRAPGSARPQRGA